MNLLRTTVTAMLVLGALSACSPSTADATGQATGAAAEPVVSVSPTPTPAASSSPTPTVPVADEFSKVVDGVLYQGTEKAPVRIGTDIPGQPPAAEATFVVENWEQIAQDANKYVVSLAPGYSDHVGGTNGGEFVGWYWKVFGLSRYGSFRELDNSGYQAGNYLPSREAALAGPYTVDGRVLDRAEYILAPISDRYAGIK